MSAEFPTIQAVAIGSETLLGVGSEDFPLSRGNCFSMDTKPRASWKEDGGSYRIVNFYVENLRELVKRGIGFPFEIHPISERHAVIHDPRIPDNWYATSFCETCCPEALLPVPQKLRIAREIAQGARVVTDKFIQFSPGKKPRLSAT